VPDTLASPRRLPGVRFEVLPRTQADILPRMDIALFVGFATSGPLEVPVAVESLTEFEAVFGSDFVLAREASSAEPVRGLLHPSVRGFFSQGGRRCWVQRVAGDATRVSVFPLPALLVAQRLEPDAPWRFAPATLVARSPGRGADGVQASARVRQRLLRARPLPGPEDAALVLSIPESASADLRVGDLVRISFDDLWVHGRIDTIEAPGRVSEGDTVAPEAAETRRIAVRSLVALRRPDTGSPELRISHVALLDLDSAGLPALVTELSARGEWLIDGTLAVTCRVPATRVPQPDEVVGLRFDATGDDGFMTIAGIELTEAADVGDDVEVRFSGHPFLDGQDAWPSAVAAWRSRGDERVVTALSLDLQGRVNVDTEFTLERLGMATAAQTIGLGSTVFDLPDDDHLFASRSAAVVAGGTVLAVERRDDLGRLTRRFPFAASVLEGEVMLLPLAELPGFGEGLGPVRDPWTALERDGLTEFSWTLFAEPALALYSSDILADRAEAMRHAGRDTRPLRGMHVAFGADVDALADEPTLLAVPDAVHPGWVPIPQPETVWTELPPLPEPPDPCAGETFKDCVAVPVPAPRFVRGADPLPDGRFTLSWTRVADGADYELEESSEANFGTATPAYRGGPTRFTVLGKRPVRTDMGVFYYRVRAHLDGRRSAWSRPVRIHIGAQGYQTRPWRSADLLAIHRLMLRTAAGRGDMLAVLAMPHRFDGAMAAAHAATLRATRRELEVDATAPMAIGVDEGRALSHGALYHPWLMIRRDEDVIMFPPDGSVSGQLAAGALDRGAWIAVANKPLRDVVAVGLLGLRPSVAERQRLLEAQVNLLRSTPHGFVISTADTLIPDTAWRPVNVRRLMSLLRRLALRRGITYVFEPNDATLRRTVERGFEAVLDDLFRRGAFAGARPDTAYRVEVGDEVNTMRRRDLGQFWVELKVAPALPLSFLTVRLLRNGERVISKEAH
jgi:hypothetical protein